MTAIANNWRTLGYATEELKGNREVVMAALAQDRGALEFASEELKGELKLQSLQRVCAAPMGGVPRITRGGK